MSAERSFEEARWVRIMCCSSAQGVWDESGAAGGVEEIPVPDALRDRILQWQIRYDEYDSCENNWTYDEWDAFDREGLAIAKAVKAHLPSWTVVWQAEVPLPELPDQKPGYYCYEILADGSPAAGAPRCRVNWTNGGGADQT